MAAPKLADYIPIVGEAEIEEIKTLARVLDGKRMKHVNSTAVGGGVAEILHRLVPLLNELGIKARWKVIKGGSDFFCGNQSIPQRPSRQRREDPTGDV